MINADDFEIEEFRGGCLSLTCSKDGMGSDLVFASGAMNGDLLVVVELSMKPANEYRSIDIE